MSEQAGEKTEQPTEKRKLDARKKGTVARSTDLTGALVLLAAALTLPGAVSHLGPELVGTFRQFADRMPDELSPSLVTRVAGSFVGPFLTAFAPVLGATLVMGLVANLAQVGFHASGQALVPDFKRLDPLQGTKRLFSKRGVFEGFKAMAKLGLFVWIAWAAVSADWDKLVSMAARGPGQSTAIVASLTHTILVRVAAAWLVLAALDYIFQGHQTQKQLMMTRDELRREMKEQEGSPEVKMAQSQRRRRIAKGALGTNLKKADVVVTNPTHFAVAIAYERDKHHAPMVVAKGADFLALRIRELAKDLDVPLVENRRLARTLYDKCEVGDFVPRELFGPVAEILAYVYKTVKKVRS